MQMEDYFLCKNKLKGLFTKKIDYSHALKSWRS